MTTASPHLTIGGRFAASSFLGRAGGYAILKALVQETPMSSQYVLLAALFLSSGAMARTADAALGLFTDQSNVGSPSTAGAGSADFDAAKGTYTISGGGLNTWAAVDAFHYAWKKIPASSNISLTASVEFAPGTAGAGPAPQSLPDDPPIAGPQISLCRCLPAWQRPDRHPMAQHRGRPDLRDPGAGQRPQTPPHRKRGDYLSMSFGSTDQDLQPAAGTAKSSSAAISTSASASAPITPRRSRRPSSPMSPSPTLRPSQAIAPR